MFEPHLEPDADRLTSVTEPISPGQPSNVICLEERTELPRALVEALRLLLESPQPSQRQMAERLGISKLALSNRLLRLERRGVVNLSGGRSRAIDVLLPTLAWPRELPTREGHRLRRVAFRRPCVGRTGT